ncbi:MAG: hypothetical protein ACFFF4_09945 [Candidatus Thorarchaeota archaeon]
MSNRDRILEHIKQAGHCYPSEIATCLDIDIDEVFKITTQLIREGKLEFLEKEAEE